MSNLQVVQYLFVSGVQASNVKVVLLVGAFGGLDKTSDATCTYSGGHRTGAEAQQAF